jgi:RNA polymerase sigma-70 factor (ECF subfamily)
MDEAHQRRLARGLRQGHADAWKTLYEEYSGRVWDSIARWMGPRSVDVADVVQETFLAAARSARTYDPDRGSLWLWLLGIARNHAALYYRRQERQDRLRHIQERLAEGNAEVARWLENREQEPSEALLAAEMTDLVRAALLDLPVEYEAVLTAKYLEGTSVEEIAASEATTTTAIRSRLARARRALKEILLGRVQSPPLSRLRERGRG